MTHADALIVVPLDRDELARRWRSLISDPAYHELAGKIELNEWGEILVMSPVGKTHALISARIVELLRSKLGGHALVEAGVTTELGIRAPDVAWCSDTWLAAHPEEAPLASAPEICVEVASESNALPKLREKANAYLHAGAREAWIVFPVSRKVEVYSAGGVADRSALVADLETVFV